MPFDPNQHMRQYRRNQKTGRKDSQGKDIYEATVSDYLDVRWRLVWLREQHPDAHIITDLHTHEPGYALFRATVTVPNGGSATGWGSETREDFGDYLEKAETKALGRALAALGFGTAHAAELDEGGSVADSPVERRETAASAGAPTSAAPVLSGAEGLSAPIAPLPATHLAPAPPLVAGATQEQRAGYLRSLAEVGVTAEVATAMVRDTAGVTFEEATRAHLMAVYRAAQTGRLHQVDGRWHIVEPPDEAAAAPVDAVGELAAAVR